MTSLIFPFIVLILFLALAIAIKNRLDGSPVAEKPLYAYRKKQFLMTKSEHEFFGVLVSIVGSEYHIFPQVHLPTILESTVTGQNWRAARAHIDRKSVDFVLCDKQFLSPVLAIEFDDKSHERPERIARDSEVERIFELAGLPLLRVKNQGKIDTMELSQKIKGILGK